MRYKHLLVIPIAFIFSLFAYFGMMLIIPTPAAQAHAFVIGSDPVDGSTISSMPDEVHIFFNANISPLSNAHVILTQNGSEIDISAAPAYISPTNPRELITPIKTPARQPEGSYEIKWTALSNGDGHTTYGLIGFNVGFSSVGLSGTTMLGPGSSNNLQGIHALNFTNLLAIFWEWIILLALIIWIGILVIEQYIFVEGGVTGLFTRARKLTFSLQWLCLYALLFGDIVSISLRATQLTQYEHITILNSLIGILFQSNYGHTWLLRIILILATMGLLYSISKGKKTFPAFTTPPEHIRRATTPLTKFSQNVTTTQQTPRKTVRLLETPTTIPTMPRSYAIVWWTLATCITFTYALSASTVQVLHPYYSVVLFTFMSLIAQGIWLGGFAYLSYVLLPILLGKELEYNTETLTVLIHRFAPLSLVSMLVQLVCVFFLDETSLSTVSQLWTDPFGRTLLIQTILLLATVLLTIYAFLVLRTKITRQTRRIPVVHADLPTRRTRQSELNISGKRLQITGSAATLCGAAILLCSAFMAFFAPPIRFPDIVYINQPAQQSTNATGIQTKQMGNLSVTLQVLPLQTGYNHTVIVAINDQNNHPITNAQVTISMNMATMDMGTAQQTISKGTPVYITTFTSQSTLNMAGLWNVQVEIQEPSQAPIQSTFAINMNT
ncbi:MAG TPA: copper resistance protein CopC [Dictyobacter sp.]|jgi:methionine-rich copper-binding protein CopC/putative copper export protein|nr:copper resistance protein CopC [Dictyobacter sp.]